MNKIKIFTPLLVALLSAACAGGAGVRSNETAEQTIARRALERWDLLIAKQPEAAWDYLTPGYRSAHDEQSYVTSMRNRPVTWDKVEYKSMECDESVASCFVRLQVTFRVRSSLGMVGEITAQQEIGERWLQLDNDWYVLPKD